MLCLNVLSFTLLHNLSHHQHLYFSHASYDSQKHTRRETEKERETNRQTDRDRGRHTDRATE